MNRVAVQLIMIGVIIGVVYSGVIKNGLVWDDLGILENNPYLSEWKDAGKYFSGGNYTEGGAEKFGGKYYKPVLSLWLMGNYKLWGGVKAGGFHGMQVGLHMVNVGLVYVLIMVIMGKNGESVRSIKSARKQPGDNLIVSWSHCLIVDKANWIAFWVALIWGVHPMNVESVAYISAAQEPLYSLFCLLGLLVIVQHKQLVSWIQRSGQWAVGSRQNTYHWWVVGVASVLWLMGMLSKESAVVLPVIVVGYLWLVDRDNKLLVKYLIETGVTFGIYLWLRLGWAGIGFFEPHSAVPIINAPLVQRLMTVPYVLISYLRVLVFPRDLFIGNYRVIKEFSSELMVWVVVMVAVVGWVVREMLKTIKINKKMKITEISRMMRAINISDKGRVMIWLMVWVVVGFGLVSGVVGLDMTFAERWMYFPSIGLIAFAGLVMACKIGGGQGGRITNYELRIKLVNISLVGLVGVLGWRTYARVGDWKDGLTLYGHDWLVNQQYQADGYDLVNNLGLEMEKLGKVEKAKDRYEESVAMNPNWWVAYNNLGVYYHNLPDYEKAKDYYHMSIEKGNYYLAWENLAVVEAVTRDPELPDVVSEGLMYYPKNVRLLEVKKYSDQLNENVRQ